MLVEVAIGVGGLLTGVLIGRVLKKEKVIEKTIKVPGDPLPATPYLRFYALADYVEARALIEEATTGISIFVNIEKLNVDPLKRRQFLESLKEESSFQNVVLRSITPDLIMIVPKDARIEVKTISKHNYPTMIAGEGFNGRNENISDNLSELTVENY